MKKNIFLLAAILMVMVTSGCSMQPVKPWERDSLAQRKMQLDPYPNDTFLDEHIYFSKEASRGGAGLGGGGCGCN